ncbi:MAG TPA: SMI1/KNR4 family protein [Polyangiaceae bacterium]|nr:SMI1/KNR4 family protein [Polyangiaceae bacterium]
MSDAAHAIATLLAERDPRFDPPPFEAAIAEEALGPSGAPGKPHRRLLELLNGGYFFDHALHLFGACASPAWHGLRAWNDPATWRNAYEGAADGLVCFGEDAFGDQFAYDARAEQAGTVVVFEAELGCVVPAAPSFVAWLEALLASPATVLPIDVIRAQPDEQRVLAPGTQLFAYPPLFTPESRDGVSLGHVDAVEAMRFRGQLASRVRGLPPGSRVRIDLDD